MNHLVSVYCITFNHSAFITDALDGFCSQDTSFPFVSVIIDDASTDGTDKLIMKYYKDYFETCNTNLDKEGESEEYFFAFGRHIVNKNCYFAIYLLKKNHFQLKKPKWIYLYKWAKQSEFVAICEGDDYWVSREKLQRQVSFMRENVEYSMTCSRALLFSIREQMLVGENYCYSRSREVSVKDIIYRRGLFISTCTIVYRKSVDDEKPEYWSKCAVGDYPLQIACALKGKVWYFDEPMAVYRIDNPASWLGSKKWYNAGADPEILRIIKSSIHMFKGFAIDYPQYSSLFKTKIAEEINRYVPTRNNNRQVIKNYLDNFKAEINNYSLYWKIDLLFRKSRFPKMRGLYQLLISPRFSSRKKMYKRL